MTLAAGTRLGTYEITGQIGAGGMGEVYRAKDTKLGREVAIKTLPSALASDKDRLARFDREAKLLAALNHAHIAAVYGLDAHEGTQFLAMELVEGQTLEAKLKDGALPVEDALQIGLQIAEALEAAHDKGVVHRDLKPGNVMVTRDGQVKVLDFGLAKAFAGDPSQAISAHSPALSVAMTQAGLILGTAGYMSPEQASGQATDQRADVWAFGVVLYEMLTGLPVFSGESVPHILAAVLQTQPDWNRLPKRIDPRLKRLLERCLTKKVRDRYHSMADVRVEIQEIRRDPQGGADSADPQPLWKRALAAAATLVLGAVLASVYLWSQQQRAAPTVVTPAAPVSRFVITPPAEAPLASLGGAQLAISPDGERIAYFAEKPESGNVELYVRELDTLEARPIPGTEGRPVGNMNLFFSADGKSIGYFAPDRGGLISVTIDGRPSVKIVDTAVAGTFLGATWAADNTLIYSSGARLQSVSAGGGDTPEPLIPERQGGLVAAPVLLPGGRALLFHAVDGANDIVGVLDLETGEEKTLIEGGANPAYSDTGHIVFARGTTLMAVPFAAAELSVTAEPVALIQGVRRTPGGATHFALSANGTLVYEPSTDDTSESLAAVVWVDRAGEVAERAVSDLVNNPRDPRLAPDNTRLVLVTGAVGDGDLWSYDLGGRPPIPLSLPSDNRFPVWSPDSRQVAFAGIGGAPEVFTLPADGSVLAPQSLRGQDPVGVPHVWSAAGELILVRNPANPDIVAIPATTTGDVRPVVVSDYAEYDPALSPNGRWLAYVSNRTGENEIWVQEYPDGVPMRVSRNGGFEPQWSRDGRELFYWQGTGIVAVAVETEGAFSFAAPVVLFSGRYFPFPGVGARTYDVASDGRFLMILPGDENTAAAPASIIVVQNFTEELKQRVRPNAQ